MYGMEWEHAPELRRALEIAQRVGRHRVILLLGSIDACHGSRVQSASIDRAVLHNIHTNPAAAAGSIPSNQHMLTGARPGPFPRRGRRRTAAAAAHVHARSLRLIPSLCSAWFVAWLIRCITPAKRMSKRRQEERRRNGRVQRSRLEAEARLPIDRVGYFTRTHTPAGVDMPRQSTTERVKSSAPASIDLIERTPSDPNRGIWIGSNRSIVVAPRFRINRSSTGAGPAHSSSHPFKTQPQVSHPLIPPPTPPTNTTQGV